MVLLVGWYQASRLLLEIGTHCERLTTGDSGHYMVPDVVLQLHDAAMRFSYDQSEEGVSAKVCR